MDYKLNDLRNFMMIARSQTLTDAARRLGVSQPALSASLKSLETDLKQILLYRSRNGISLTPSGQRIFEMGQAVFIQLEEIARSNEDLLFGSRRVRIGTVPMVGLYHLPEALRLLQTRVADYKVDITQNYSRFIQIEIQQGRLDVGLVVNPLPTPDLVIRHLSDNELTVWEACNRIGSKIFCNTESVPAQEVLRKWKKPHLEVLHLSSFELLSKMCETGLGYGIFSSRTVDLFSKTLLQVEGAPKIKNKICLISRPEFGKTLIEKEVLRALTESFRQRGL